MAEECPAYCSDKIEKLDRDIHGKPNGIWACLGKKVGWKQLGGTVSIVVIILLGVMGTVYLSYSRGQDKQDAALASEVQRSTKADKAVATKQTEIIIRQTVMDERLKSIQGKLIEANESRKDTEKLILEKLDKLDDKIR